MHKMESLAGKNNQTSALFTFLGYCCSLQHSLDGRGLNKSAWPWTSHISFLVHQPLLFRPADLLFLPQLSLHWLNSSSLPSRPATRSQGSSTISFLIALKGTRSHISSRPRWRFILKASESPGNFSTAMMTALGTFRCPSLHILAVHQNGQLGIYTDCLMLVGLWVQTSNEISWR